MAQTCDLSPSEQMQLQQWVAAHGTPQQVALRCRIVLAAGAGQSNVAIAKQLSINRKTAILWRNRFAERRLDGLWEVAPGRGRRPTFGIEKIAAIVNATLQTKPEGTTHWSCRTMATAQGISKSTVSSIWQAHNANVRSWLHRHPRFALHFVPTSSSWLNLVERWFSHLDQKAIRRGIFRSVDDLRVAIGAFLTAWNKNPKPFVWTATVDSIMAKLSRCRQTLEKIQPRCPRTRKTRI